MEKVSLREVILEIGRNCNLKCKHCMKGESENVAMSDEVMDALLDNVHFIDDLFIGGGEPLLYVDRLETLLKKCKEKNVKVNYITVVSNCTFKSEEFVRVFNEWGEYSTFKKNLVSVSDDIFHKEYTEKYLPDLDLEENIEWYRDNLKYCEVQNKDDPELNLKIHISDEGRVNSWTQEEKDEILEIIKINKEKNVSHLLPVKNICQGEENACGYGCVKNCIPRPLTINPYGKMFLYDNMSFQDQDDSKNPMTMGSILEKSIYTIIKEWNESIDEEKNGELIKEEKNEFWTGVPNRMIQRLSEADELCKNGEFKKIEKILDEVEKYCSVFLDKREKILEPLEKYLEFELEDFDDPLEYIKYQEKNNPQKYKQVELIEKLLDPEMFSNLVIGLEKSRDIFEKRKELNIPGSIFGWKL